MLGAAVSIGQSMAYPQQPDDRPLYQLREGKLESKLRCDDVEIQSGEPLLCDIYLVADRDGGTIIVPRFVAPFKIRTQPTMVVSFEIETTRGIEPLTLSYEATHGLYDRGELVAGSLVNLFPGGLVGWRFDLDGRDWVLPAFSGRARIRGTFRIDLTEPDKNGEIYPAVRELAGRYIQQIEKIVAHGQWTTNWVDVTLSQMSGPPKQE